MFPITTMCSMLRVSRAGYYAWVDRPPSAHAADDQELAARVREIHELTKKRYGAPRVQKELAKSQDIHVSRKRVARLMRQEGLRARPRRRFRCTTMSDHDQPVAPNLLDRNFEATAPNQKWVGDTTELLTGNGKLFLAVILDLYSKFVVGWALSPVNDRHLTIAALEMAIKRRNEGGGAAHSDPITQVPRPRPSTTSGRSARTSAGRCTAASPRRRRKQAAVAGHSDRNCWVPAIRGRHLGAVDTFEPVREAVSLCGGREHVDGSHAAEQRAGDDAVEQDRAEAPAPKRGDDRERTKQPHVSKGLEAHATDERGPRVREHVLLHARRDGRSWSSGSPTGRPP